MAAFGADEAEIEAMREREREADRCEIHPDNVATALAFFALETNWRYEPGALHSTRLGIEYASIYPVLTAHRIPRRRQDQVFRELQVMERAALRVLRERAADSE